MSSEKRTQVLIAGRGPVGMTLALLLARYGVATMVVDPATTDIKLSSKAVLMHGESLEILGRVGIGRFIRETGVRLSGSRVFVGDQELRYDAFPDPDPDGYPAAVNFPQSETERLLLEEVNRHPMVDLRLGWSLTRIMQHEDHVAVQIKHEEGAQEEVLADYLAGCDGARSTVRKELGLRFDGHAHDDHYLIVDIRADLPFPDERRFFFHPRGGAGRTALIHPQPFSLWHLDFQVGEPPDLDAEARNGSLDRRIRAVIGEHDYEVTWSTSYVFKQLLASRFSVGRCFLVGDAAHLYAPYGARGLNSGLADADNLAWKLGLVATGQAPSWLLETYDEERRGVAAQHFAVTAATAAFMAPTTRRGRWRRDLTLALASRIPAARQLVDSGHFYRPLGSPRSRLTVRAGWDGVEAGGVPGELLPDLPALKTVSGAPTRLRSAYSTHPMVVTVAPPRDGETHVRVRHLDGSDRTESLTVSEGDARGRVLGARSGGLALLVRPDGFVSRSLPMIDPTEDAAEVADLVQTAARLYRGWNGT